MKNLINVVLFLSLILFISGFASAQEKQSPEKKAVVFKIPEGLMPAQMSKEHKGLLMLDAKSPSGLFIAYTPDDQKSEDYIIVLRDIMAKFFDSNKDAVFEWKESALPASEKFPNESGKLLTAMTKEKEVQVIAYARTISEGQDVVYGYFAMKDLKKPGNSAEFADDTGKGIKLLDNFRKKLAVSK